ncbi:MAG: radical SAM family heme chaperone HemW [Anaerolineae bacterium]|nr:radical SAM family heme chaperone HemW [Anaerolineae bacterium]
MEVSHAGGDAHATFMQTALYVHVPFCRQRCTYCDFNTYSGLQALRPAYVEALRRELHVRATRYSHIAGTTLYFGGGTPSLLSPDMVRAIIADARKDLALSCDAEITMEANPGTVDAASLAALREAGVNRLSLGVQSSHDDELRLLGRIHTWDEAVSAVTAARQAGFDNLSVDLMYGLPGQSLARWQATVERTLTLSPEHLSLYALTVEPETPLSRAIEAGEVPVPDPDLAADMYVWASETVCAAGFWQYEISNWAHGRHPAATVWELPPGGRTEGIGPWASRHNLVYWRNQPWLGLGAGGYSWLEGRRWSNVLHPTTYIQAAQAGEWADVDVEIISPELERGETLMMGLRLAEGVTESDFRVRFGVSLAELYAATIARLVETDLVLWNGLRLRLSPRGRLLGNRVFGAFLP